MAWLPAVLRGIGCKGGVLGPGVAVAPPCPPTSTGVGMHPFSFLALICLSALQTLCEQLRKENEALKAKLDKGLEQRDQAAERLR